jgi:hypothetical protein
VEAVEPRTLRRFVVARLLLAGSFMIPLIGLLLCVYLVFKGFEILQIALCSANMPASGAVIGFVAVAASVLIAVVFGSMFISSASSVPSLP